MSKQPRQASETEEMGSITDAVLAALKLVLIAQSRDRAG
jgi:hypothetical protein